MTVLRLILPGTAVVGDLLDKRGDILQALADLYAYPALLPATGWVRANVISTLDGSATGPDGLSGSISSKADKAVFSVLRSLADVILVGAGTVRAEGYRVPDIKAEFADRRASARQRPVPTLAIVTRSGDLPRDSDLFAPDAPTLILTCADADVDGLKRRFGPQRVVVAGEADVDPAVAVAQLAARGLRRILLEGGPQLLGAHVAGGRLDEVCLTWSPVLLAGDGPRVATGPAGELPLRLAHLIEADGVFLGRWLVRR